MDEPRSAIGSLMHEHQLILRVVGDMRRELELDPREQRIDVDYIAAVVDFIGTYADECHHGKEEDILFRDLGEKPMPSELAAEMQRLIDDHVWARATTKRMLHAAERYRDGDGSAGAEVVEAMRELADFYPDHIERQDHHFFKPAIELFTQVEREAMSEQFRQFDRHLFHERYRDEVERLEARRDSLSPDLVRS